VLDVRELRGCGGFVEVGAEVAGGEAVFADVEPDSAECIVDVEDAGDRGDAVDEAFGDATVDRDARFGRGVEAASVDGVAGPRDDGARGEVSASGSPRKRGAYCAVSATPITVPYSLPAGSLSCAIRMRCRRGRAAGRRGARP
jgi:hypothetical protein